MVLSRRSTQTIYMWCTHLLAATTLIGILTANLLFWPIPYLGFSTNPYNSTIVRIEPGSVAANAGLQEGDRITHLYGHAINEVYSQWYIFSLLGPRYELIPINIERDDIVHNFHMAHGVPSFSFQLSKVTGVFIALLCWFTGYMLGLIRRHEAGGLPIVAWFWLLLAGTLGCYFVARYASFPVRMILQWFMITTLVPLVVYIHTQFPVRLTNTQRINIARYLLVGTILLLNSVLLLLVILYQPSLVTVVSSLSVIIPIVWLLGFIGVGLLLWYTYRHTRIAHIRRQIRLIAGACFLVVTLWIPLLVIPNTIFGTTFIAYHWIDLIAGLVPLAYLVGGVAPNLYHVDRMMMRLSVHVATITVLAGLFLLIERLISLESLVLFLWISTCLVLIYHPVHLLLWRVLSISLNYRQPYKALQSATTQLTTTLDTSKLVNTICEGVSNTFDKPALAFYLGDIYESSELHRVVQQQLPQLPVNIEAGVLTERLCHLLIVNETREVFAHFEQSALSLVEEQALQQPHVALWCPIRHPQGYLLGVLLLGMRDDLDPYRDEDITELRRFLEASALALSNSFAYAQQCEAEAVIRQLYQHLQQVQDETASAIARELHDEIINVNVRLNIEALHRVIKHITDPTLRRELELILESEHTISETLRLICEQLYPTGIDDPLGLAAVLRMQVDKYQATWRGICRLYVENTPYPIESRIQREIVRITREAIINAIKHADASEIAVYLRYPDTDNESVQVVIHDNGCTGKVITPKTGHWGIRNMYESARTVNGELAFCQEQGKGTRVVFTCVSDLFEDKATVYSGNYHYAHTFTSAKSTP